MKKGPRSTDIVIELKRPYTALSLAFILFGGSAAFMVNRAQTNDRGLIINGLIELDSSGADVFYAVMAVLSVGFSLMGALSLYNFARRKQFRVVLGRRSMTLPPSVAAFRMHDGEEKVLFKAITSVELHPQAIIIHTEEKRHAIATRWLPEGWPARELADTIVQRTQEARK